MDNNAKPMTAAEALEFEKARSKTAVMLSNLEGHVMMCSLFVAVVAPRGVNKDELLLKHEAAMDSLKQGFQLLREVGGLGRR